MRLTANGTANSSDEAVAQTAIRQPQAESSPSADSRQPAAAIARNKGDIASLLDHLGRLVQTEDNGETEANWGIVGSLAHVREHLIECVQFLSGLDREDVESALDDMHS